MKHIFFAIAVAIMAATATADINRDCPQFTATGAPTYVPRAGDQELCRTNYAVIHRCDVRAPVAVFEHLTPAAMSGPAKRKDNFRADPDVAPQCRATLADYATVGRTHDRGHMSPAANNTQNDAVMSESFLLSNMVAQVAGNNRGIWKQLETWERDWASKGGDFYIVSGGIYDVGHPVTGAGLGIPTRLYKLIIDRASGQVMAYLMPNAALPVADLPRYQTTVAEVERATGFQFNLNKLTHR